MVDSEGYPYYLTATLLETVCAHVGWNTLLAGRSPEISPHARPKRSGPSTLSLSDALPASQFQQLVGSLELALPPDKTGAAGLALEQDWLDADLRGWISDPAVPHAWRTRFASIQPWTGAAAELPLLRLDIFTDGLAGSFSEGPLLAPCASWAFSVWAVTPAGAYLIGWAAHDSVPVDTPFWIGEQHEDAVEGETLAIAWALAWVIDWGHAYEVPLLFRYDATAVGAGIFGMQRPPLRQGETRPTELVEYAIALRQRAAFWYRIDHEHVAGHSGHVGNELCDQLAKQARRLREDPYDRLLPVWPQIVFRHPLRAWLWMARLSSPQLPALSALEAEAHRLQTVMGPSPPAPSMGVRTTHLPEVDLVFNLVLSSYNVLTLFDPGVAHGRKARAGSLGCKLRVNGLCSSSRCWRAVFGRLASKKPDCLPMPSSLIRICSCSMLLPMTVAVMVVPCGSTSASPLPSLAISLASSGVSMLSSRDIPLGISRHRSARLGAGSPFWLRIALV